MNSTKSYYPVLVLAIGKINLVEYKYRCKGYTYSRYSVTLRLKLVLSFVLDVCFL